MVSNIYPFRTTCSSTTIIIICTNCNDRSIRSRIIFIYPYFINASTATSLQTARTLWGQSFNGTANITGTLLGVESLVARSGRINNFSGYFDDSGNPATGTICITLPNGWTSSMNIYSYIHIS